MASTTVKGQLPRTLDQYVDRCANLEARRSRGTGCTGPVAPCPKDLTKPDHMEWNDWYAQVQVCTFCKCPFARRDGWYAIETQLESTYDVLLCRIPYSTWMGGYPLNSIAQFDVCMPCADTCDDKFATSKEAWLLGPQYIALQFRSCRPTLPAVLWNEIMQMANPLYYQIWMQRIRLPPMIDSSDTP